MRDELPPATVVPGQKPAWVAEEHLEIPGEGAKLAASLVMGLKGLWIVGDGPGLEKDAPAPGQGLHGDDDIVDESVFRDRLVIPPPHRVNRTGATDHRVEFRLFVADPFFQMPVEIDSGGGTFHGRFDLKVSADGGRFRRGKESIDQNADGIDRESLPRVGKNENFATRFGDGAIEGCGFSPAFRQYHDLSGKSGGERAGTLRGSIRGAIADKDDLPISLIETRGEVFEAILDPRLLVPRGQHEAERGWGSYRKRPRSGLPGRSAVPNPKENRVTGKRVTQQGETQPKEDGGNPGEELGHRKKGWVQRKRIKSEEVASGGAEGKWNGRNIAAFAREDPNGRAGGPAATGFREGPGGREPGRIAV